MFTIFCMYAIFQKNFLLKHAHPHIHTRTKLLPCSWYSEETFSDLSRTLNILNGMTQSARHLLPSHVLTPVCQATSFPSAACVLSTLGHSLISSHISVPLLLQLLLPRIPFSMWLFAENATSSVRPPLISQTKQIFPGVALPWRSAFLLSRLSLPLLAWVSLTGDKASRWYKQCLIHLFEIS